MAGRNAQIIDEAAEWFVEFSCDDDDQNARRAFDAWLRKSPEHVRAYLEMFPLWQDASKVDAGHTASADELIELARAGGNVVPLEGRRFDRVRQVRRGRPWLIVAAAALLVCVIGAFVWLQTLRGSTYETGVGEQRAVSLPDGSIVEINARSRVRVRYAETRRDVILLEGQALFKVHKDASRPFVVYSGDTRIRAVGTQFDVDRSRRGTVVTVLEGRVAVIADPTQDVSTSSSPVLTPASGTFVSAGEQTIVRESTRPRALPVNVEDATAWRERRLVFSGTPLTVVAEQFNRYNERRLLVRDTRLDKFLVSGTFSSTDPASLVRFLHAQSDLRVEESDSDIEIFSN
ncbi:FecR family protein [Steroidobacter flavus]|uniref:FecR family protein n=1 Tax=Steroidobacter flavus TaxID=1842136 RepID=A0ABV8T3M6_9GAMM